MIGKHIKDIAKYKYEFAAGFILLLYMLYYLPRTEDLHDFCVIPYALSYRELGLISRGVIGSLLDLFFRYITINEIWTVIFIQQLLLIILTIYFLSIVKKHSANSEQTGFLFLEVVFTVNPASIAFLFYWGNYGRFDLFMIAASMVISLLIIKGKGKFIIPVLCIIVMAIHQGFAFMYFPCVLMLLFYHALKTKKRMLLSFTAVSGSCAFIYFQWFAKITSYTFEDVVQIVQNSTNFPVVEQSSMIKLEYFTNVLEFIPVYIIPVIKVNALKLILVFILMLPLEIVLYRIWKVFVKESGNKIYWLIPIMPLICIIPKFVITCDYGRDLAALFLSEFIMIFTISAMNDNAMRGAIGELSVNARRKPILYLYIMIELAALGKFEAANILDITDRIVKILFCID